MAEEYVVEEVREFFPNPDTECWRIIYRKPDGTTHYHFMPKVTLENLAAEYLIDPDDVDTLISVALHQCFVPNPLGPDMNQDVAAAAGMTAPAVINTGTIRRGDMVPLTLHNSPSTAEAREAHLLRCQNARVRVVPPKSGSDPLDIIRQAHNIHPRRMRAKAQRVDIERWTLLYGGLPIDTPDDQEAPRA
ncbi:hypothetical protein ABZ401_19420 [Streptomyces sp. NPDC005892]|uniref:hypothetical protein n=1 Tax=Streptomyces sp. NPDC005892 TaxID=3155593 RepID=UPI0033F0B16A